MESIKVTLPQRLQTLPPYLFAELDRLKQEVASKGVDVINLGIGDPDLPTPSFIIEALNRAAGDVANHHYPPYSGTVGFRRAVADWYARRFQVQLDPDSEVLALIGSKDGIAHLPLALINPGDTVIVPDPGYPVYSVATSFAGGKSVVHPLTKNNNFHPDFKLLEEQMRAGAKLLFLNYPNNPTAAACDVSLFERVAALAAKYNVIVCHDNAYSELYYDGKPSPSFLQAKGAKAVGIEMHSLSKSFNMTGWRIGFAVGHRDVIAALGKVKTNVDSGVFQAVQVAGTAALREGEAFMQTQRRVFQERRDKLAAVLKKAGFNFEVPTGTFYLWVDVPGGGSGIPFCQRALRECGVVVTPGVGMGKHGEGYFRITITAPSERLVEAGERLKKLL